MENWRWDGVPFYLRTGKHMARKSPEIVIQFKLVPHRLFEASEANRLIIRLRLAAVLTASASPLSAGTDDPEQARSLLELHGRAWQD